VRRKWSKFAACDIALLDEVWKASPQVSNMLLDGLEERLVTDGDDDRPIPLISAIAASNEIPEDKAVQAAYDRFLVRLSVGYIRDPDDFRTMLVSNAGAQVMTSTITTSDIRLLAAIAEACPSTRRKTWWTSSWKSGKRWGKANFLTVAGRNAQAGDGLCSAVRRSSGPRHLGVARWTRGLNPTKRPTSATLSWVSLTP